MANVVFERVWKIYPGEVVAVRDADFAVEDGEFMVIVGPSGCGKSTLLRMVAGLEEVTRGTISIDGRVVNDVAPKDRDVAMVFQNYALYPHMSVFDNMAFGLRMRKYPRPKIQKRVSEAAEVLGLTEFLDRKPKALSGGQRQRVAVGRAIVRKPKVFLFDEPLSNLDAKLRVQMRTEIARLHRQLGATMLYVTHDQVEAMTMGTRITLMRDGVIQQIDDPLALYREPANRFVAGFIGSPAMNMFPGKLERRHGDVVFDEGSFTVSLGGREDLAGFPDRVLLGIRPEDLVLAAGGGPPQPGELTVEVEVVEPLGSEMYVHGRAGNRSLIARVEPDRRVDVGASLRLRLDPKRVHFFDSDTGVALRPSAAGVS
jgi:multiple sugar transport system ATP-binding protein